MKIYLKTSLILSSILILSTGCSNTQNNASTEPITEVTSQDTSEKDNLKEDTFLYENENLGFSFNLPSIVSDKVIFEEESINIEDETINRVYVNYQGEENESIIIMLEEMSISYWDKMQQEEGPKPIELGKSNDRVVVMYPLQSNPYEQGTNDFETINKFEEQSSCIFETFKFL